MSQRIINIGSESGAGDGDDLRTAFDKVNQNFTEVYSGNVVSANTLVYSVAGRTGNIALTVSDILGAASTGDIAQVRIGMAANSAADRAYTDAAVASLSSVTDLDISGGTLSNVHIDGHSWGNVANLNVTNSLTVQGAVVAAQGISSLEDIVATGDLSVGGLIRFADNSTLTSAPDLTTINTKIAATNANVSAANLAISALRANITAANGVIAILQGKIGRAHV